MAMEIGRRDTGGWEQSTLRVEGGASRSAYTKPPEVRFRSRIDALSLSNRRLRSSTPSAFRDQPGKTVKAASRLSQNPCVCCFKARPLPSKTALPC
jgi:hypothetical protein